jgi:transcription elongation GreA/GreB family factor
MDDIETLIPTHERRRGRGPENGPAHRGRQRRDRYPELLTGHGRTVLSRRLADAQRQLAEVARRRRQIDSWPSQSAETERTGLDRRALALAFESNQMETLLELSEHPELEIANGIAPGSVIEVVDAVSGRRAEYRLIGGEADRDSSVVGVGSPVGLALLGRRPGSLVTLNASDGLRRVRIVSARPIASQTEEGYG